MELDELRSAWQALDRQLARQYRLDLAQAVEKRLEQARGSLRPLFLGQLAQLLLLGLPMIALASALWMQGRPLQWHVLVAGIAVHVYGVAVTALSGATLGLIRGIDYAAPVVDIQRQLARLRHWYLLNGRISGLSWWLLWLAVLTTLSALGGVDLYANAPAMVWSGLGIGVAGLLSTWAFHRWSRCPARTALGARPEAVETGNSLRRSQRILDEIAAFERE